MSEFSGYTRDELEDAKKHAVAKGDLNRERAIAEEIAKRRVPHQHTFVRRFVVLGTLVPLVGLFEILGGLQGAVTTTIGIIRAVADPDHAGRYATISLALGVVLVLFFILSVLAGILLLAGRRSGLLLSAGVQLAQLIYLKISTIQYMLVVGGAFLLNLVNPTVGYATRIGSQFAVTIGADEYQFQLGVNLIALGALSVLAAAHEFGSGKQTENATA